VSRNAAQRVHPTDGTLGRLRSQRGLHVDEVRVTVAPRRNSLHLRGLAGDSRPLPATSSRRAHHATSVGVTRSSEPRSGFDDGGKRHDTDPVRHPIPTAPGLPIRPRGVRRRRRRVQTRRPLHVHSRRRSRRRRPVHRDPQPRWMLRSRPGDSYGPTAATAAPDERGLPFSTSVPQPIVSPATPRSQTAGTTCSNAATRVPEVVAGTTPTPAGRTGSPTRDRSQTWVKR
jgi:hypothetical protein